MTDILERSARDPDRVLRYSAAPTGVVDVYDGGSRGVLLLVHGGFWRARYDRMHLRPMAAALADAGWLVALPEFRRVGDPGGGFPGSVDDIRGLVRGVRSLVGAPEAPLTVVGHSAGGHLAMLAAGETDARVVSLAGVLDLAAAQREGLSNGAADEFLGGAPAAGADPMSQPLPAGEIALVHGVNDTEVPVEYSRRFAERDSRIRLSTPNCGHYELIDPESSAFAEVTAAIAG
ncbi:alpha/beta hydrolase family protein [Agrococcus casei]|uniref:alpha/beta hydrolase family protein n=1 Tax=Agrococcus casei TaxID=343512 RepID=UPI003F93079F